MEVNADLLLKKLQARLGELEMQLIIAQTTIEQQICQTRSNENDEREGDVKIRSN